MSEEQADYITVAMELLKGETSVAISPPSRRVERRGRKMVEVEEPAYVKFSTDFKSELADLDVYALKVLIYIGLSIGFETGTAYPGVRKIAENTKMNKDTVTRAVAELEEKGFLEVWRRDGGSNIYRPTRYFSIGETVLPERTPLDGLSAQKPELSDENVKLSDGGRVKRSQPDKQESNKKGDLVDAILVYQKDNTPLTEFERVFGFGSLPWYSNSVWDKFAKFILARHDWFADYVAWRAGEGKYNAFSNKKIRENPRAFMDTGYPEFEVRNFRLEPASAKRHKL